MTLTRWDFDMEYMSPYQRLMSEVGEEAAKKEMARRRSMVKNLGRGGFAASNELAKRASKLGVQKRNELRKARDRTEEEAKNEEQS